MQNRPPRTERIQARQEKREDKEQARLRGLTLEKYREQRDKYQEEFQGEQEAKLSGSPYEMTLDSSLQLEGNVTIKAWEGDFRFLRNMIESAYLKVNAKDTLAGDKARTLINNMQNALGTDLIKTEGTLLKMAGNKLSIVGAMTGRGQAVETASPQATRQQEQAVVIDEFGRSRTYSGPEEPKPVNWEEIPDNGTVVMGAGVDVATNEQGIPDDFIQLPDGTYTQEKLPRFEDNQTDFSNRG